MIQTLSMIHTVTICDIHPTDFYNQVYGEFGFPNWWKNLLQEKCTLGFIYLYYLSSIYMSSFIR
jgi:hypothetical protein